MDVMNYVKPIEWSLLCLATQETLISFGVA